MRKVLAVLLVLILSLAAFCSAESNEKVFEGLGFSFSYPENLVSGRSTRTEDSVIEEFCNESGETQLLVIISCFSTKGVSVEAADGMFSGESRKELMKGTFTKLFGFDLDFEDTTINGNECMIAQSGEEYVIAFYRDGKLLIMISKIGIPTMLQETLAYN